MRLVRVAARAASTFSLLGLLAAWAIAGPYADFNRALGAASTPAQVEAAVKQAKVDNPDFTDAKGAYLYSKSAKARNDALKTLKQIGQAGEKAEALPVYTGGNDLVKRIKASPLYHDEQLSQSNWWGKALENFGRWLANLFKNRDTAQTPMATPTILGPWVVYGMWGILGALVLFFLFLAARHFRWRLKLKRKTRALLEEDEPERTLDEWLERANELEAAGKYREAVRCLYFACLLRFDEARVARFDRGQTNWEHLRRIQASPLLPPGMDFEPPTRAFDHIWYGMITRGEPDVRQFRAWYQDVTGSLMEKAA